ncbi:MAG: RnfABCDGE type electron transport complex subunit D [Candidatus Firestonebacteria bacterium]|nr:RnfABCDGE type electron transport complex subunit D [Candidatus Firestonebacteria bacterium]
MENQFILSSSPHIKDAAKTKAIMYTVIAALLPSGIAGIYFFGWNSLFLIIAGIVFAVATEALVQKLMNQKITILDGSAILTGLLLAYNLPPDVPIWIPIIGSIVAIAIAKQVYGGLGHNPFNPALVGRVFLLLSWPVYMTTKWIVPLDSIDAITNATPLSIIKQAASADASPEILFLRDKLMKSEIIKDLFFGKVNGCIGETSALLLILGGLFLIYMDYIDWRVPVSYLGSFSIFIWIFGNKIFFSGPVLFHLFAGGIILGAFFMATDPVTSPMTRRGRIIFGIGCGVITGVIRIYGTYPEGTSFAILIMNAFTPLIDKYITPDKFGVQK